MKMERRGYIVQFSRWINLYVLGRNALEKTKSFEISKDLVFEAYKRVKSNGGSGGIDGQTISSFEEDLKDNLYRLWNRMSSGSYFPLGVRRVSIPKNDGSERILGIPTVVDRIAQTVVKMSLEPDLNKHFHVDSFGYRPGKSALEAVGVARKRCWEYDWVLDLDICGFFDNLDHALLMRAVHKHTDCKWILLYIERWLAGSEKGTPQGGVISPLLANLFLHYAFDLWMQREQPEVPFERYADDMICHCRSEQQAKRLKSAIEARLKACGLALHSKKTRIVYCRDQNRQRKDRYPDESFNFLGYRFQARRAKGRQCDVFVGFLPGVSPEAMKRFNQKLHKLRIHCRSDRSLNDLAQALNPMIRGWLNYFSHYYPSALYDWCRYFNDILVKWAKRKYKKFKRRPTKAANWLGQIAKRQPNLFAHWRLGGLNDRTIGAV